MDNLLLALPLGVLVGLSLGALGAGGSILAVPALILVLGQSPHEATATSLVVVGSTAAAAAVAHRRRGAVRLRAGCAFVLAGIAGSVAASYASVRTDANLLALAFTSVMLVAATFMWRGAAGPDASEASEQPRRGNALLRTLVAGSMVGVLTGFFGIGGGFLAVPALTWALGLGIVTAVGTSLFVIALNSAAALAPRLAHDLVDARTTALFVVGGLVGGVIGAHAAHAVDPVRLKRAFAVTVVVTALALAAHTVAA